MKLRPTAFGVGSEIIFVKKKSIKMMMIIGAGTVLAGSALAQGDISAPVVRHRALPPLSPSQSEGGLQRGVRVGNPLQMFNPLAPAEFGSGRDFVTPRDAAAAQPRNGHVRPVGVGLRLFSFWF